MGLESYRQKSKGCPFGPLRICAYSINHTYNSRLHESLTVWSGLVLDSRIPNLTQQVKVRIVAWVELPFLVRNIKPGTLNLSRRKMFSNSLHIHEVLTYIIEEDFVFEGR